VILVLTLLLATRTYRVGGEVKAPVAISQPEPRPPELKCRGLIVFKCVIDERGRVTALQDLSKNPDATTRWYGDSFKRWRFRPATLRGKPVAVEYNLTINLKCQ